MFNKSKSIFFQEGELDPVGAVVEENKLLLESVLSSFNWRVGQKMDYGMLLNFGPESKQTELKYTCSLTRLSNDAEGNFVFELNRTSAVYIDEILPDLIADKLAFEVGKVFYPLHLMVDPSGELRGIANTNQIQSRWPGVKDALRSYFQGDFFEEYLQKMEKLMLHEHNIFSAINRTDWFIRVFFQPFYKLYPAQNIARRQFFPNLPTLSMQYQLIENMMPELNHFGAIELIQQGLLEQDADYGIICSGRSEAHYIFHPQTRILLAANGYWESKVEGNQVLVGLRMFYLPEEDGDFVFDYNKKNNTTAQADLGTGSLNKQKDEKSTWAKLFNL
ncbi:hypothetical protein [Sphingobacterium ginsenosidimutans]|uniref:Uncharacterized protein n=1 Tax=Sphingobacterium ginsenosidimutans TaxID=687845 RepID=A0ABP8A9G6_9SPHI